MVLRETVLPPKQQLWEGRGEGSSPQVNVRDMWAVGREFINSHQLTTIQSAFHYVSGKVLLPSCSESVCMCPEPVAEGPAACLVTAVGTGGTQPREEEAEL